MIGSKLKNFGVLISKFVGGGNQTKNNKAKSMPIHIEDHIRKCAEYSVLSYSDEGRIASKLREDGANVILIYQYHGMLAYIVESNNTLYVCFRGVGAYSEFVTMARFWKTSYAGVKVHTGFAESIDKISRFIVNDLTVLRRDKKVVFTGHSFGGAMALLLTIRIKPDIICTIGSPKAGGGKEYRNLFKDIEVIRIDNKNDIIPRVPTFLPLFSKYDSIGKLYELNFGTTTGLYANHKIINYYAAILRKLRRKGEK